MPEHNDPREEDVVDASPFTPLEESIFATEREYPKYSGAKDDAIRQGLGISPANYFQVLNALMDRPEAMERYPQIVGRLHRIREQKQNSNTHRPRP